MQKCCWWYQDCNGNSSLTVTSSEIVSFNSSALLYPFGSISKVICLLVDFILIKLLWAQGCVGDVIFIALQQSGAKWSEQQLLVKLKEKPPQGEGYTNALTMSRQRCRCVMSGFWGEGNSLLVVKLLEAGCVLLEYPSSIYWQFTLGQWMLENKSREARPGQWALLYDSTLSALGAESLLLQSETEGKS